MAIKQFFSPFFPFLKLLFGEKFDLTRKVIVRFNHMEKRDAIRLGSSEP
jgi:hypothetical protein